MLGGPSSSPASDAQLDSRDPHCRAHVRPVIRRAVVPRPTVGGEDTAVAVGEGGGRGGGVGGRRGVGGGARRPRSEVQSDAGGSDIVGRAAARLDLGIIGARREGVGNLIFAVIVVCYWGRGGGR